MVEFLKSVGKANAKFWTDFAKGKRKFWGYETLIISSVFIEFHEPTIYFPWYYWLFVFLTFCGVNWLDKVKWFTGESFGKGKR